MAMRKLSDFGYAFNKKGVLRSIKDNTPFVFDVFNGDRAKNQQHYEQLGEVINEHIYKLLEEKAKLHRTTIPIDAVGDEACSFVFESENARSAERLMIIIHGSGVVRAGQWSRKLIINHSLESGSQLPYIHKAKELGYGVLVLNSNLNRDDKNRPIRGSEDPSRHFEYVWKHVVRLSRARYVAIVAHSYGGVITLNGATSMKDVIDRTFAVAFTDSVHLAGAAVPDTTASWLAENACNWVSSREALDTVLSSHDCPRVSAGTRVHEETSWKAFESVWRFIQTKLNNRNKQEL